MEGYQYNPDKGIGEDIRILAINPGSTSTKIAVYQNSNPVFLKNIKHSVEDLDNF